MAWVEHGTEHRRTGGLLKIRISGVVSAMDEWQQHCDITEKRRERVIVRATLHRRRRFGKASRHYWQRNRFDLGDAGQGRL